MIEKKHELRILSMDVSGRRIGFRGEIVIVEPPAFFEVDRTTSKTNEAGEIVPAVETPEDTAERMVNTLVGVDGEGNPLRGRSFYNITQEEREAFKTQILEQLPNP